MEIPKDLRPRMEVGVGFRSAEGVAGGITALQLATEIAEFLDKMSYQDPTVHRAPRETGPYEAEFQIRESIRVKTSWTLSLLNEGAGAWALELRFLETELPDWIQLPRLGSIRGVQRFLDGDRRFNDQKWMTLSELEDWAGF